MGEGSAPSKAGRQESDIAERRETRSAEKRVPKLVEERKQDTADTPESGLLEDILSASTARITSFKSAKAIGEQLVPPPPRLSSANEEDPPSAVGTAAAPAASHAATTWAPAKAATGGGRWASRRNPHNQPPALPPVLRPNALWATPPPRGCLDDMRGDTPAAESPEAAHVSRRSRARLCQPLRGEATPTGGRVEMMPCTAATVHALLATCTAKSAPRVLRRARSAAAQALPHAVNSPPGVRSRSWAPPPPPPSPYELQHMADVMQGVYN
eukprot:3155454-Pleurochrysis_carterae.AAC.2